MIKFLFLLLLPSLALAQNRTVAGDIFPGIQHVKNYIKNSDFEQNKLNITDASSIATRSTSSPLSGIASLSIDATATSQVVKFSTYTFDPLLYNQNCLASFMYNGDASLYTASVLQNGSAVTGTSTALTNASTNAVLVAIHFACGNGASGATELAITSTGNGAAIKVDKVFIGLDPTGFVSLTGATVTYTKQIKAANYTALVSDDFIEFTAVATLTMYAASAQTKSLVVKNNMTSANVTINRAGSDTFDNSVGNDTSLVLLPGQSVLLISDGTSVWTIN